MSNNLQGLKALAERMPNVTPDIGAMSALYDAAEEALKMGDEERAYVLFCRFSDMYVKVRSGERDQKIFDLMYTKNFSRSIEETEKLTKSLESRYSGLATSGGGQPPKPTVPITNDGSSRSHLTELAKRPASMSVDTAKRYSAIMQRTLPRSPSSDESVMCVDTYEDDWMRLTDVRLNGSILEYAVRRTSTPPRSF